MAASRPDNSCFRQHIAWVTLILAICTTMMGGVVVYAREASMEGQRKLELIEARLRTQEQLVTEARVEIKAATALLTKIDRKVDELRERP